MVYLLILLFAGNELELPGYSDCTVFGFSEDRTIWVGDDKSGIIYKVNPQGTVETLGYGLGSGPGEFYYPLYLLNFEKKDTLMLVCRDGNVNTYSSKSGKFKKKILGYMVHNGVLKWDDEHFLMIWASETVGEADNNFFRLYDLNGKEVDSWAVDEPQWQKKYLYDVCNGHALGPDKTVFLGDMAKPELFVFKYRSKTYKKWKIKPPVGYREPPKEQFDRRNIFNKKKVNAYLSSFTYITDVVISGSNLIVTWRHPRNLYEGEEPLFTYDVYDPLSRKPKSLGNMIKGFPRGVTHSKMVSMHRFEEENTHLLFENLAPGDGK